MRMLPSHREPGTTHEHGQAMVEFAIVLPVLALLLVMAIDFGRVFFGWVALHNATRIAADFGAAHVENWSAHEDRYRTLVRGDLEAINCFPDDGTWDDADIPDPEYPDGTTSGSRAVVTLECEFELLTPLAASILGGPVSVASESTFPIHKALQQPLPPNSEAEPGGSTPSPDPDPDPEPEECEAPNASFTTSPAAGGNGRVEGSSPLTVSFTDTSTAAAECPITSWAWTFGNGSSSLQNPTQTFMHPGNGGPVSFNVQLFVTNSEGSNTATITVRVSQ